MGGVIDTMKGRVDRMGLWGALYDAHCKALHRVAALQILRGMAVGVQDVPDPELFEAPGFSGRFASAADLAALADDASYDLPAAFVEDALGRGDRCYGLWDGEVLAAYGWYSNRPTPIDDRFLLHFDLAYTYMYKGFTLPAYRGRRLHAVGMCQALRAFTDEGKKGLVSHVAANNFASLKSVARMGYRIFGDLYLVGARRRPFAHATRGCRPYGFRAVPMATPPAGPPHDLPPRLQVLADRVSLATMRVMSMFAIYP